MFEYAWAALLIGFICDIILGDPRWLYHPVCLIGSLISTVERIMRRIFPQSEKGLLVGGFFTVLTVLIFCGVVPWAMLYIVARINTTATFILGAFMCYQLLAVKCLRDESLKVYIALKNGTVDDGRKAVSMIVGRDTHGLDEKGIVKATVETVAENFSDGVIAPMFYMMIGGPVLMFIYKGINTMDSMLGYKNDKYLYFGRFAAKLDDFANYIPARIAGLILIIAAACCRFNAGKAYEIFKRDRYNHASPNSAQTESTVAGALEVQLAGNAYYFGKLYEKKTIGDNIRPIEPEDINRVNKMLYVGSAAGCVLFAAIGFLLRNI